MEKSGREENRREEGRAKDIGRRFLGWVNSDYDEIEEEEEYEEEDHEEEHEEESEEVLVAEDDAPLEDYEGDDEFDYPDEIVVQDTHGFSEAEIGRGTYGTDNFKDDEIDYADTAPAYQETVHMTVKQKRQMRRFRVFYLALSAVVAVNVIGVLLLTVNYLPPFGAADNPAVNEVYQRYVEHGVAETGALNIVSAVLYAYRSFDTLGEAFVLFTAAMGVILLMRETKGKETE